MTAALRPAPVAAAAYAGADAGTPGGARPASAQGRALLIGLTAVAPVLWGTTYVATTELLPPDRPLVAAALRALPVGLVLALAARARPHGEWWWRALLLGTLNIGAFFALLFVAAYRLPGGAAATLTALQPLFALGLAAWWLATPPTRRQLTAAAVGVLGVALVVGGGTGSLDAAGVVAALAAALSMGAGVVLTKRWAPPVPPIAFTGWQLVAGGLVITPVALIAEGLPPAPTADHLAGYAHMGILGTGLAYVLWIRGIGRLPVASVTTLALLSPLTATLMDWLVLHEPLAGPQLVGAALVLAGVLAGQIAAPGPPPGRRGERAGAGVPNG